MIRRSSKSPRAWSVGATAELWNDPRSAPVSRVKTAANEASRDELRSVSEPRKPNALEALRLAPDSRDRLLEKDCVRHPDHTHRYPQKYRVQHLVHTHLSLGKLNFKHPSYALQPFQLRLVRKHFVWAIIRISCLAVFPSWQLDQFILG